MGGVLAIYDTLIVKFLQISLSRQPESTEEFWLGSCQDWCQFKRLGDSGMFLGSVTYSVATSPGSLYYLTFSNLMSTSQILVNYRLGNSSQINVLESASGVVRILAYFTRPEPTDEEIANLWRERFAVFTRRPGVAFSVECPGDQAHGFNFATYIYHGAVGSGVLGFPES
jgi:hypothetical protein